MPKKSAIVTTARRRLAELIHPDAPGFRDKVTPRKPDEKLFLFTCKCGGKHFRHAGYMELMLPCRKCLIFVDGLTYDVTDQIDLEAWQKLEVLAQQATGPGGDC